METSLAALTIAAGFALAAWAALLLHPDRPWTMRPRDDEGPDAADPPDWPPVAVLVPARDEASQLPLTLPALAGQDYPGPFRVLVVDDRSTDGTAAAVRALALPRVEVLDGAPLPEGWVGKMWALHQALGRVQEPWILLTDADILHAPDSLRRLVAGAEAARLALDSRMALLRADSAAERLLVPAFTWFFNVLYPLRRVNDPLRVDSAAAAGGCVLVRHKELLRAGGFEAIKDRIIDDVSLARNVKRPGVPIRLLNSSGRVRSLRGYPGLAGVWAMVRRTAFTQLGRSWAATLGSLLGLLLLFLAPPAALAAGLALRDPLAAGVGGGAWLLMTAAYAPAPRLFGLSLLRALSLPLAGLLYAGMTLDSAFRGSRVRWR